MQYNTNFFNIVSAQPSTAMSCVAANILEKKNTHTKFNIFGFPLSGSQSSITLAMYKNDAPVQQFRHNNNMTCYTLYGIKRENRLSLSLELLTVRRCVNCPLKSSKYLPKLTRLIVR